MIKFNKICRILIVAAFLGCSLIGQCIDEAKAQNVSTPSLTQTQKDKNGAITCSPACSSGYECICRSETQCECVIKKSNAETQAQNAGAGTNTTQSASAVTGCSSDYGLFGGLIETGRKIFSGLRDLIYVVAGFGIIGVAVGGFFGNLNWKWLGAIIIALVVIATTGEIINMITGCDQFTQKMITDTLK